MRSIVSYRSTWSQLNSLNGDSRGHMIADEDINLENSKIGSNHNLVLEIVTPEQQLFSDQVEYVSAPGSDGEMGILPGHCALICLLKSGILKTKRNNQEFSLTISGGFLEVRGNRVIVLADLVEREKLKEQPRRSGRYRRPG